MRALRSKRRFAGRLGALIALFWAATAPPNGSYAGSGEAPKSAPITEGLRLFLTDWSKVEPNATKGDGLGPVYNERSCIACHSQGGIGGAGGSRVDVQILTDLGSPRLPDGSIDLKETPLTRPKPWPNEVFTGFATERTLVLHRFSTDPGYEAERSRVLTTFGLINRRGSTRARAGAGAAASYRNTPALFGSGLIDAIPEIVLETASLRRIAEFPEILGRPGRLRDGRVGRFGWKAQMASLDDFVRTACANELGLENPGHAQSPDPFRPKYQAPGLDLTDAECTSLTRFVASVPRPVERSRPSILRGEQIAIGREVFVGIGCATCHMPKLGDVEGIYSDLLLHDMGQPLSDSGEYYGAPSSAGVLASAPKGTEWRTPPLWGLHDSGPYLHDGRAATSAEAIALHGGEAQLTTERYQKLDRDAKKNLSLFLGSLKAPPRPEDSRKLQIR